MDLLSSHIGSVANADSLIAACGVSSYVQGLQEPEMAMLLIEEDMSVSNTEVRSIFNESTETGEILNKGEDNQIDF